MNWRVVVPIKAPADRKSRLAAALPHGERAVLTERMLEHVLGVLRSVPRVGDILLLTPAGEQRPDALWARDEGRGLNAELDALIGTGAPSTLIVLPDLPRLEPEDIERLLDAAEGAGAAFAGDRHGSGTNALALREPGRFRCRFGEGSLAAHRAQMPGAPCLDRPGLAFDVDWPEDLALLPDGFRPLSPL